jgi:hypothetical protein
MSTAKNNQLDRSKKGQICQSDETLEGIHPFGNKAPATNCSSYDIEMPRFFLSISLLHPRVGLRGHEGLFGVAPPASFDVPVEKTVVFAYLLARIGLAISGPPRPSNWPTTASMLIPIKGSSDGATPAGIWLISLRPSHPTGC